MWLSWFWEILFEHALSAVVPLSLKFSSILLLAHCLTQCWRKPKRVFFDEGTLQNDDAWYPISPMSTTAYVDDTITKLTTAVDEKSLKTDKTQISLVNGGMKFEAPHYHQPIRNRKDRNMASLQRAKARAYYKQIMKPEEDTLFEIAGKEMPEIDLTSDYVAKLFTVTASSSSQFF